MQIDTKARFPLNRIILLGILFLFAGCAIFYTPRTQSADARASLRYDLVTIENDGGSMRNLYIIDHGLTLDDCSATLRSLRPQPWRISAACYTQAESAEIVRRNR